MKKFTLFFLFAIVANLLVGNTAFGQITQRGTTTTDNTIATNQLSFAKPTGLAVGDVMLVSIAQGDNNSGQTLSDASAVGAGWAPVSGGVFGVNGNSDWWGNVFYKVATASDVAAASFVFNVSANADGAAGGLVAFYNVNTAGGVGPDGSGTGPFDVAAGSYQAVSGSNSATITAPGIITATNGAAVIMFGMAGNNNTFSGWVTGTPGSLSLDQVLSVNSSGGPDEGTGAAMAIMTYAGATGDGTATMNNSNRNAGVLIALKPASAIGAPNLWAANGTGAITKMTVNPVTGVIIGGPASVVVPSTSTAALAKNVVTVNDPDGCLYYLNRDDASTLNGVVTIYAVKPDGTGNGSVGTIDMNGALNDDFSYVRMGFDASGKGWILAGSGSNIYIASFVGKGTGSTLLPADINTFGNLPLTVAAPGVATEFQNGDLAISGNGVMYALANVTDGQTYIYTLNSLTTPTTLTRKWTVQTGGGTFSGSVNGLAWTQSGSLHFSTATGIYFIDQATANTVSGTVQAALVPGSTSTTLTDLASDKFPTQSTLPVKLGTFTVTKQGGNALVSWTTLTETSTDHFEIERSLDGVTFSTVGSKQAAGSTSAETSYQYLDPLNTSARIIYYRLKTVDVDANKTYSKIVALRLDGMVVKNFTVYPNPFTSDLKVQVSSAKETTVTLRISNSLGQQVVSRNVLLQTGENTIVLSSELSALRSGMYILEISTEDGKLTQKIIKR